MKRAPLALAALGTVLLSGCGLIPHPVDDSGEPIEFAPVIGIEQSAEVTPDPEGPGHVFNHRHESQQEDPFSSDDGLNAFTMQWPDGTASWCFTYISAFGEGTHPQLECKDVPEGWDK